MKIRLLVLTVFGCILFNVILAKGPAYIQTNEGVIVFTEPAFTGKVTAVKLTVIADNIVRVMAFPGKDITHSESLVTVYTQKENT